MGACRKTGILSKGQRMAIKDWPQSERPRERLLTQGAAALSDAELLAIFLRVGVTGRSALDLAGDLLVQFKGINALFASSVAEFTRIKGLGEAKYVQLMAAHELARRALVEQLHREELLNSPGRVRDYLKLHLGHLPHEVFMALFLDAQNRLIAAEELFRGTLTQTSVYPREVVKRSLHHNAAAVVFAHNHPSGVAEPSQADELLTRALMQALQLVDVRVLDHLIVARGSTTSFAERGLI
jgi:DNA repair protein RadC